MSGKQKPLGLSLLTSDSYLPWISVSGLWWRISWILDFTCLYGVGSSQDADANARFQKRFSPNTGLKKRQKRYAFHWNVDFQSKWSRFEKRFLHSKNRFRKRFVVPENSIKAAYKSTNRCQKRFQYVQKPWMNDERIWAAAFGSVFSTNNFPRGKHVSRINRCQKRFKKNDKQFQKVPKRFWERLL